jgi:hypothetical protein
VVNVAGRKHRARDCLNLCQNALKLVYVHLSVQKFSGVTTSKFRFEGEGEGKRGWDWKEYERKGIGRKDEGEGKEGRGGTGKGGRIVKAGAPKLKFWRRHCSELIRYFY